jgi:hypothetical protein
VSPMPAARDNTHRAVNPGFRTKERIARSG